MTDAKALVAQVEAVAGWHLLPWQRAHLEAVAEGRQMVVFRGRRSGVLAFQRAVAQVWGDLNRDPAG